MEKTNEITIDTQILSGNVIRTYGLEDGNSDAALIWFTVETEMATGNDTFAMDVLATGDLAKRVEEKIKEGAYVEVEGHVELSMEDRGQTKMFFDAINVTYEKRIMSKC